MRDEKSVGRPREFDEDASMTIITDLFWSKGFDGTSLSDIMEATGLKKGSLYAAFGDKQAMYLKAIAHYERQVVDRTVNALRGPGDALERIKAFLSAPIDVSGRSDGWKGCFLCNASADRAAHDSQTADAVREGFSKLESALTSALRDLDLGWSESKRRGTACTLLAVYAGLRTMARGGVPTASLRAALHTALGALQSES